MATKLPKYLQQALSTGEYSDFSIFVVDREGNKQDREESSQTYFTTMSIFRSPSADLRGTEAQMGGATIDNITNNIFDLVLRYLYTENLGDMMMEQAGDVFVAADYLQLDDLKTAALDCWKKSLKKLPEKNDVIKAFRELIAWSLNIKIDESWRNSLESLLLAMNDSDTKFNIAEESDSFIAFFVGFFGQTHPLLSALTLAKWATAADLKWTAKQQKERKKVAEEQIQRIKLIELSFHNLAVLSANEVFPAIYMLKKIQEKAEIRDTKKCDEVEFNLYIKKSRIVELEYEATPVLFQFMGLQERTANKGCTWKLMNVPDKCFTKVKLYRDKECSTFWLANLKCGAIPKKGLKHYQCESGEFQFQIALALKGEEEEIGYEYDIFCDRE